MNKFFKKVPENAKKYIDEEYKKKKDKNDLAIDIDKLMEMVLFCV